MQVLRCEHCAGKGKLQLDLNELTLLVRGHFDHTLSLPLVSTVRRELILKLTPQLERLEVRLFIRKVKAQLEGRIMTKAERVSKEQLLSGLEEILKMWYPSEGLPESGHADQ